MGRAHCSGRAAALELGGSLVDVQPGRLVNARKATHTASIGRVKKYGKVRISQWLSETPSYRDLCIRP